MCQSACPEVQMVYCGKTADCIWIPFGVTSGVGRGMAVLDGVEIVEGEEVSRCNQWGLCGVIILCPMGWRSGFFQITLGFLVL